MTNKFFIGCRVKLIHPVDQKDFGLEGFLESFEESEAELASGEVVICDCEVVWDDEPNVVCPQDLDQLQVVLPDGAQPSTMSMDELLESVQENVLVDG